MRDDELLDLDEEPRAGGRNPWQGPGDHGLAGFSVLVSCVASTTCEIVELSVLTFKTPQAHIYIMNNTANKMLIDECQLRINELALARRGALPRVIRRCEHALTEFWGQVAAEHRAAVIAGLMASAAEAGPVRADAIRTFIASVS